MRPQGKAAILGGKKYEWHYYTADARARDELAVSVAMSAGRKQLEDGVKKRYNDKLKSILKSIGVDDSCAGIDYSSIIYGSGHIATDAVQY